MNKDFEMLWFPIFFQIYASLYLIPFMNDKYRIICSVNKKLQQIIDNIEDKLNQPNQIEVQV